MNAVEDARLSQDWSETLQSVDPDVLARLHSRLAVEAQDDGLLDVAYRTIDSPVGTLLLAATEAGLVRVAFASEGHDQVLEKLAGTVSPRILRAPSRLDRVARELEEYFQGVRSSFDVTVDFRLSRGFRREVLTRLPEITYGHTASYGTVAQLVGNPRAVRAVGSACATNPIPVVVPCHRVILSSGAMGRYAGGEVAKRTLLDLESRQEAANR